MDRRIGRDDAQIAAVTDGIIKTIEIGSLTIDDAHEDALHSIFLNFIDEAIEVGLPLGDESFFCDFDVFGGDSLGVVVFEHSSNNFVGECIGESRLPTRVIKNFEHHLFGENLLGVVGMLLQQTSHFFQRKSRKKIRLCLDIKRGACTDGGVVCAGAKTVFTDVAQPNDCDGLLEVVGASLKTISKLSEGRDEHVIVERIDLIKEQNEGFWQCSAPVGEVSLEEGCTFS